MKFTMMMAQVAGLDISCSSPMGFACKVAAEQGRLEAQPRGVSGAAATSVPHHRQEEEPGSKYSLVADSHLPPRPLTCAAACCCSCCAAGGGGTTAHHSARSGAPATPKM